MQTYQIQSGAGDASGLVHDVDELGRKLDVVEATVSRLLLGLDDQHEAARGQLQLNVETVRLCK